MATTITERPGNIAEGDVDISSKNVILTVLIVAALVAVGVWIAYISGAFTPAVTDTNQEIKTRAQTAPATTQPNNQAPSSQYQNTPSSTTAPAGDQSMNSQSADQSNASQSSTTQGTDQNTQQQPQQNPQTQQAPNNQ